MIWLHSFLKKNTDLSFLSSYYELDDMNAKKSNNVTLLNIEDSDIRPAEAYNALESASCK